MTAVATGNLMDRDTANADQAGGIQVSGSGHAIRSNVARDNDGWGIYAAPGNVVGGATGRAGRRGGAVLHVRCTV